MGCARCAHCARGRDESARAMYRARIECCRAANNFPRCPLVNTILKCYHDNSRVISQKRNSPMSQEKPRQLMSGYAVLATVILAVLVSVGLFIGSVSLLADSNPSGGWGLAAAIILFILALIACNGFFTLLPNEACVLNLFGSYSGTARESGFWWVNPFMTKRKLSLRARNLEGGKLKVNDKQGNPIEIAAVVVWRVQDTAQACFDVENFEAYVRIQSETAVRHLANSYA